MAAGNFYINDKSTGSVVGQQPFGGGRMSGKSFFNLKNISKDLKELELFWYSLKLWYVLLILIFIYSFILGTNDKAGGPHYILRWTSPQAIKETFVPLRDIEYPYMKQ